ncbi:DUF2162 domain-containing protein [Methanothermobacter wolfeii]|uniref:DUF2162 domain-containing protein n=1 Tax=Methanothermobacter wolfeii TaxID=145261 RepID=UPI0024B39829|nr:DUF2162 domain-containing protein [Methanothermobacter wolfeii]MDI6701391.1 DUF2162 domain-containing protein [Methanothermobacter wolfeii]
MDIANLLWQAGILSVLLIFGVKIGLAMGFAGLSKKMAALVTAGYGLGVFGLSALANAYISSVQGFFNTYSSLITIIMAAILIFTGVHTLREWKEHRRDTARTACVAMVAPCPCCFGAVLVSIILISPIIGVSAMTLGKYSGVILAAFIAFFYIFANGISRAIDKPYPVLLGNFMLFAGLYFLTAAIVLPNVNSVMTMKMTPLTVPGIDTIIYVVLGTLALIGLGIYLNKKKSTFIE